MTEIKKLSDLCSKAEGFEKSRYIKNFTQRLGEKEKIIDSLKLFYEKYSKFLNEGDFSFLLGDDKVKLVMKDTGNTYLPISDVYKQFRDEKDDKAMKYVEFYLIGSLVNIAEINKLKDVHSKFKQAEKVQVQDDSIIDTLTNGVTDIIKEQKEQKLNIEEFMVKASKNEILKGSMTKMLDKIQSNPSELGSLAAQMIKKTQQ